MKILFLLLFVSLPFTSWSQKIEDLTVREHVNMTLLWVSQSLWNTGLINEVVLRDTTDLGPTIRFAVADDRSFTNVIETVRKWKDTHEQISIVQPWTSQQGSNILILRSDEPAKLLIGFTYHKNTHHLIIFVGENLEGL